MVKLEKGLDIPIAGPPRQEVDDGPRALSVALVGGDYPGLRPGMAVSEGDVVKLGQELFRDKATPGVRHTSPAGGRVVAVNRGARRSLISVVIEVAEHEEELTFAAYGENELLSLSREQVVENLTASGLWTALRARPFGKVPSPRGVPRSIFVTAMDTNPLAADPVPLIWARDKDFQNGLRVLTRLTEGPVFVCARPGANLPTIREVRVEEFAGRHPAGLPGTHIHFLDPVGPKKTVWHLGYQDVLAFGRLFTTGRLDPERIVALAGPKVVNPRLVRTRMGASTAGLTAGSLEPGSLRVVSGSVLSGYKAEGARAYLGRYHTQVAALEDKSERELLGWTMPGLGKFSERRVFASAFCRARKLFAFDTSLGGSRRAVFPTGSYQEVMPLDIEPTYLLRTLMAGDADEAVALGCLELDEEDLALCTYVDCGKNNYGRKLREVLTLIEKEG